MTSSQFCSATTIAAQAASLAAGPRRERPPLTYCSLALTPMALLTESQKLIPPAALFGSPPALSRRFALHHGTTARTRTTVPRVFCPSIAPLAPGQGQSRQASRIQKRRSRQWYGWRGSAMLPLNAELYSGCL